jgi:hypothetical protein
MKSVREGSVRRQTMQDIHREVGLRREWIGVCT